MLASPRVVRVLNYSKILKRDLTLTRNIYLREDFICQYCGINFKFSKINLDHILTKFRGGKTLGRIWFVHVKMKILS